MRLSTLVTPAIVLNLVSAALYALVAAYAKPWATLASYVYAGSSVLYLAAVVAKVHGDRALENDAQDAVLPTRLETPISERNS